jgi:addiction module RelE/StbE family toxin
MKVRYTLEALIHISAIHAFIDRRNPAAATRVVSRLRQATEDLAHFPERGRHGAVGGTREWEVKGLPYIIVYEITSEADELAILGVYHGAQLRPGQE